MVFHHHISNCLYFTNAQNWVQIQDPFIICFPCPTYSINRRQRHSEANNITNCQALLSHKQESQQLDNINFLHVCVKSKSMHLVVQFQVLDHNESLGTPVSYEPTIHSVQQNFVSQKPGLT